MPEIPDNTAAPQDHKPSKKASAKAAADAAQAEATEARLTVEHDGTDYDVVAESANDLELYEDVADYISGRRVLLPRIIKRLIGPRAFAEFKKKHRDPDTGRVPTEPLFELFELIDTALGE